ncbi:hypothetical protein [Parasitella parasitica]|uniref:Uncharacterized protein n=1 Tax=Parasitella parasitica TaxID=35722 RepID=A0A0B7MZZ6_9FUNG|nr:hypothetical protein [Parasitella parasitica]
MAYADDIVCLLSSPSDLENSSTLVSLLLVAFPLPSLGQRSWRLRLPWNSCRLFIGLLSSLILPLSWDFMLSLVESKLLGYRQESFLAAGIPHCPPPVFSVDYHDSAFISINTY